MGILNSFKQYQGLPREIYILAIQRFVNSVGGFVFPFLTMFLSLRLGMEKDIIGRFMLASAVAGIPGSIIAGFLVDKINRKKVLLITRTLSALIYIYCGFLGNSYLIPYLIILTSFLRSFSSPASSAMTTDLTTPENRKQSFSLLYLSMNLGLAFGFMLAGFLFEHYTSWLFWGDGLTSLLSLLLVVFFITDTRPTREEIEEINASDREGEKEERASVFVAMYKRPFLMGFVIVSSIIGFVYHQHGFIMPFHLEELYPTDGARFFGYVMTINTVIVIVFTPFIVYITKKYKPITNVIVSTITYAIGFGMLGFAKHLWFFIAATFIWTVGEIIATVNTGVYISNHSPVNHRGKFSSIIGLIRFTGQAVAPYIMGRYLVTHSNAKGWFLTGAVAIVSVVLLIVLYVAEEQVNRNKLKEASVVE